MRWKSQSMSWPKLPTFSGSQLSMIRPLGRREGPCLAFHNRETSLKKSQVGAPHHYRRRAPRVKRGVRPFILVDPSADPRREAGENERPDPGSLLGGQLEADLGVLARLDLDLLGLLAQHRVPDLDLVLP